MVTQGIIIPILTQSHHVSSEEEFCQRSYLAITGIDNCGKVVDDILVLDHDDYSAHIQRIFNILCRCLLMYTSVVLTEGIHAAPENIRAIAEFPTPESLTDLRSFFGLVNQLEDFSPNISSAAETPRPLLSPKHSFALFNNMVKKTTHSMKFQVLMDTEKSYATVELELLAAV
ncbi:uncharacterized protein LOC119569125 [Penaeus monodon]|uniref:uncharacterized protein LOC119569125 n=1 Tax=Penaeus monodon TaxID=6687 RepID=UPI0018A7AC3A|nr:uncharacterized protein LOC119569125 [Penaeus monodon]